MDSTDLASPLNVWYLDDGTLGGHPDGVESDLCTVLREGPELGLDLNEGKCELLIPHVTENATEVLRRFQAAEWVLLGSLLSNEVTPVVLREKAKQVKILTSRLNLLPSHLEFIVCFS